MKLKIESTLDDLQALTLSIKAMLNNILKQLGLPHDVSISIRQPGHYAMMCTWMQHKHYGLTTAHIEVSLNDITLCAPVLDKIAWHTIELADPKNTVKVIKNRLAAWIQWVNKTA